VDLSPSANADFDTALKICHFFSVRPMDLLEPSPIQAPTPIPSPTRHEARAVRLMERMSEKGQRLAVQSIGAIADAFPRSVPQELGRRSLDTASATKNKARGRR
jgi:hypothetical protein